MNLTHLQHLLYDSRCMDFEPCEINGLAYDSRRVRPDDIFFAVPGFQDDGHCYAEDALEKGARALVVQQPLELSRNVPQIIVPDVRRAMARTARVFFGAPSMHMKVSAVTGTNGKTSVACLTKSVLEASGEKAGLIGTVEVDVGGRQFHSDITTPESIDLQCYLSEMKDAGLSYGVIEASSHALDQGRLHGTDLASAVFTNLTSEHLDYHGDMESYRDAKARLFQSLLPQSWAILNADDPAGGHMADVTQAQILWYGLKNTCDLTAEILSTAQEGTKLMLRTPDGDEELFSPLLGIHNVYNVLAAAANGMALGIRLPAICEVISKFKGIRGRLQRIENDRGFSVLVDYAHTPDALEKVLTSLDPLRNEGRVLAVFGCGGDRDRQKRPLMGQIAERISDTFWLTSDNPRNEDPNQIIQDIADGLTPAATFVIEPDRRRAIHSALATARPGDIVLIAGKGHEDYQILGTERIHFDDVEVAREFFEVESEDEEAPATPAFSFGLTLKDIARELGDGRHKECEVPLAGISTDTRAIKPSEIFVALRGDLFDGHDFVAQAVARGAVGAVVEERAFINNVSLDFPLVRVPDTVKALGHIARMYRQRYHQSKFIGITGSNGKTTVKTFTAALLSSCGAVCQSPKSYNNNIGVPLTLFNVRPEHHYVVLEMGTNHFGELENLADIAQPTIAAITNIGDTHLQYLKNREGVAQAKAELIRNLPPDGIAVLNADDPQIEFLRNETRARVITFGINNKADVFATIEESTPEGLRIRINDRFDAELNVPGIFNLLNALTALALCRACGLELETLAPEISSLALPDLRMQETKSESVTLILDAYNANPTSMRWALEELDRRTFFGRRVLVLGEMRELGPTSAAHHESLGRELVDHQFDLLVGVGFDALHLVQGAADAGVPTQKIRHYETTAEACDSLLPEIRSGDTVFFKGSRGLALERLAEAIRQHFETKEVS